MSQLLRRIEQLFMQETLGSGAAAVQFRDKTTGTGERSSGPSGYWRVEDERRVEELFLGALTAAEKLLGIVWKDGRYAAKRHKPFDEREWHIHLLSNPDYIGKPSTYVAAAEDCHEWDIRNLRKAHGFDSKGKRAKPCERRGCSVCPAVEAAA